MKGCGHFAPPISVVLAARPESYIADLVACRQGDLSLWLDSFAGATLRAAVWAVELADQVAVLQLDWTMRAHRPRAGSAAAKLIAILPALPILSAPTARGAIGSASIEPGGHLDAGDRRVILSGVKYVSQG